MDNFDLSRRLAAEALGTGILVATVVGSGIMAETLTKDVALVLLCNTLPTGAILVVLIAGFAGDLFRIDRKTTIDVGDQGFPCTIRRRQFEGDLVLA